MTTTTTTIATVRMTPDAFAAEFGIDHAKAQGRGVCHDDGSDTINIYDHELAARISLSGYDVEYCPTPSGLTYYIKPRVSGDDLLKVIDRNNNYSIQSLSDQEPDGYVDHQWGSDAADWREVTLEAAQAAGFRVFADDDAPTTTTTIVIADLEWINAEGQRIEAPLGYCKHDFLLAPDEETGLTQYLGPDEDGIGLARYDADYRLKRLVTGERYAMEPVVILSAPRKGGFRDQLTLAAAVAQIAEWLGSDYVTREDAQGVTYYYADDAAADADQDGAYAITTKEVA